jgi:NADPH:quinone reductase-like Zn-dependent oxidoreductase
MFAIQMAKSWGAVVTGVDNTEKQEHMRGMGADHVIDYTKEDYTRTGQRYDRILDLVATRSVFAHHRALKPGGVYRMVGGTMNSMLQTLFFGPLLGLFGAKKVGILAAKANPKDFDSIVELMEAGAVKVLIDKRYALSEVADAMRYVGEGHALGKVIITL